MAVFHRAPVPFGFLYHAGPTDDLCPVRNILLVPMYGFAPNVGDGVTNPVTLKSVYSAKKVAKLAV